MPSELAQPTVAWLTAAPPSNSACTHSTCPLSLATYNGVAPVLWHTAQHSTHNAHLATLPGLTTSATRVLQPQEDHDAPHPLKNDMGSIAYDPNHATLHPTSDACTHPHTFTLSRISA